MDGALREHSRIALAMSHSTHESRICNRLHNCLVFAYVRCSVLSSVNKSISPPRDRKARLPGPRFDMLRDILFSRSRTGTMSIAGPGRERDRDRVEIRTCADTR